MSLETQQAANSAGFMVYLLLLVVIVGACITVGVFSRTEEDSEKIFMHRN